MAEIKKTNAEMKVFAPDLFDLIDQEELNPPTFSGSMFVGHDVTINSWEHVTLEAKGHLGEDIQGIKAQIVVDDSLDEISCLFTAWRIPHYFQVIEKSGLQPPFMVHIEADNKSYKFSPSKKH